MTAGCCQTQMASEHRYYWPSAGASTMSVRARRFMGLGSTINWWKGRDARVLHGRLEPACLISNTQGLSDKQLKEAERWIELYEHHDKYKLVGQLRLPDASVEAAEGMAEEGSLEEERQRVAEARAAYEQELLERAQRAESSRIFRPFRLR